MCLTSREEVELRMYKRKILRTILRPKKEDGDIRRMNFEILKEIKCRQCGVLKNGTNKMVWMCNEMQSGKDNTKSNIMEA